MNSEFMLMKGSNHFSFRVEFVFAFPPDYKHHQEQIPLEFVEMVKKCPIHTVKVNPTNMLISTVNLFLYFYCNNNLNEINSWKILYKGEISCSNIYTDTKIINFRIA